MLPDYNKLCPYNVVIFNNIENNQSDLLLLNKTFKSLNCRVKLCQHLTLDEYESAIKEICSENFSIYEYIVIVVLDNKNPYKHLISTSDGKELRINNDLLVRITQNRTLANKKRLFIIQTNQNFSENLPGKSTVYIDDSTNEMIKILVGPTVRLYATDIEFRLGDYWSYPNATVSPFIASFCKNFEKYAEHTTIQNIYGLMLQDLDNTDFAPAIEDTGEVLYGKALTANAVRDFFQT